MSLSLLWTSVLASLRDILATGGPVVALLLGLSVISAATVIYKLWQFRRARVGRHARLRLALDAVEQGDSATATALLRDSHSPRAKQ